MRFKGKNIKDSKVFVGETFNIIHREVEINKKKVKFELIDRKEIVLIIPILLDKRILMINQYRATLNQEILEFPAGKVDTGENRVDAARRELSEETGYTSTSIIELKTIYTSPHFSNEKLTIFIADKLSKGKSNLQEKEFISNEILPLNEISSKIAKQKIVDGKTILGYFSLIEYLNISHE